MAWTERYISVAGGGAHDGTTEADAWTLAEAIAAPYAAGQRLNMKAGTYTNTTTDRNFNINGTTTGPVWVRGYKTTIGDMDDTASHGTFMSGTEVPAISFTTGRLLVTGNYHLVSSLDVQGAQVTNGQVKCLTGGQCYLDRMRVECTSANSAGRALSFSMALAVITRSWFKSTTSADVVIFDTTAGGHAMIGCAVVDGLNGVLATSATNLVLVMNTIRGAVGDRIRTTGGGRVFAILNSIYGGNSGGSDGIEFATSIPALGVIVGNIITQNGQYGINNSVGGTNSANVFRLLNDFYANTTSQENGFGDSPSLTQIDESASPFTNAGSGDLSLLATALAVGVFPGQFQDESFTGYGDLGAVQRQGGTSGMLYMPNLDGV